MPRAFAYLRVSQDRHGDSVSPEQQRHEIGELAQAKGYTVVEWLEERDLSAYQRNVRRPLWDAMLKRLDEVDAVIVWELERAARRLLASATLLELLDDHGVRLLTVRGALDSVENRDAVEILFTVSAGESRRLAARVARAHRYKTTVLGLPSHPRDRFGWRYDKTANAMVVEPSEAAVIRAMAAASLAGRGDSAIARALNEGTLVGRVIDPPRGRQWYGSTVKHMLDTPSVAGFVVHKGQAAQDEPTMPGVLSVEEWETLRAIRKSRRRRGQRHPGGSPALLTGWARCASCGAGMYRCSPAPNEQYSCGRRIMGGACPAPASIRMRWLDEYVTAEFFRKLDEDQVRPDDVAPVDELADVRAEVARRERALNRLVDDHYVRETLPRDIFEAKVAEHTDQLRALRDKIEERPVRIRLDIPTVREAWGRFSEEYKREILNQAFEPVRVWPKTTWRQAPSEAQIELVERQ